MTVEALRRGDVSVLDELLDRFGDELRGVAFLILRDHAEAEDVVVETLLTALRRASTLREPASLRPWLLRVAANHAIDRRRRSARVLHVRVLPEQAAEPGHDPTDRVVILEALALLPVRMRAAVVLRYYADLPVAEVAAAMGTSPNTVKSQLRDALDRLRQTLTGDRAPSAAIEVRHA